MGSPSAGLLSQLVATPSSVILSICYRLCTVNPFSHCSLGSSTPRSLLQLRQGLLRQRHASSMRFKPAIRVSRLPGTTRLHMRRSCHGTVRLIPSARENPSTTRTCLLACILTIPSKVGTLKGTKICVSNPLGDFSFPSNTQRDTSTATTPA